MKLKPIKNCIVFIQARMSSKRLPGKSLMLISEYPIAVLSALRAGNTGLRVIVLTSTDESDNILYDSLISYGIECMRGELNNVLARFNNASIKLKAQSNDIIVRLTADNIIPDGVLIDELIRSYKENKSMSYLGSNYPNDNLPYGLNVEIFQYSDLNDAFNSTTDQYDCEHVTPWIKRNKKSKGIASFINYIPDEISHNDRFTIDTIEDYYKMRELFDKFEDPINIPWHKIH